MVVYHCDRCGNLVSSNAVIIVSKMSVKNKVKRHFCEECDAILEKIIQRNLNNAAINSRIDKSEENELSSNNSEDADSSVTQEGHVEVSELPPYEDFMRCLHERKDNSSNEAKAMIRDNYLMTEKEYTMEVAESFTEDKSTELLENSSTNGTQESVDKPVTDDREDVDAPVDVTDVVGMTYIIPDDYKEEKNRRKRGGITIPDVERHQHVRKTSIRKIRSILILFYQGVDYQMIQKKMNITYQNLYIYVNKYGSRKIKEKYDLLNGNVLMDDDKWIDVGFILSCYAAGRSVEDIAAEKHKERSVIEGILEEYTGLYGDE